MSNKQSISVSYSRTNAVPLDSTSTFDYGIDVDAYLESSSSTAYPGQLLTINNVSNPSVDVVTYSTYGNKYFENVNYETFKILSNLNQPTLFVADTDVDGGVTRNSSIVICNENTSIWYGFGNDVDMNGGYYYNPDLKYIVLPNNLNVIGSKYFKDCNNLIAINIPNSVNSISNYAFEKCSILVNIIIPGTCAIGEKAFNECTNLTSLTLLGDNSLGNWAFRMCTSLRSLYIPKSTVLASNVFDGCSGLESITVEEGHPRLYSDENCLIDSETKTLMYGCKNSTPHPLMPISHIGDYAFYKCKDLTSIVIPDEVKDIGKYALTETSITSVQLIQVEEIMEGAFLNCTKLTSVMLNEGLKTIGDSSFYGCTQINTLQLPVSVTYIGTKAFTGCHKLSKIKYMGTKRMFNMITRASDAFSGIATKVIAECTDGNINLN